MLHANTHEHEMVAKERLKDCLRRGNVDCLCREAGIDRRGWTGRQICRLAAGLGNLMVRAGGWLQRQDLPAMPARQRFQQSN